MARRTAIQSAETVAALRAMVANERDLAVRCEDRLAKQFLGAAPSSLFLCRVSLFDLGGRFFAPTLLLHERRAQAASRLVAVSDHPKGLALYGALKVKP